MINNNRPQVTLISVPSTKLRKYLIKLTAKTLNKIPNDVTVDHVVELLAAEFPDVLLKVAEENFLKGYELGLNDGYEETDEQNSSGVSD